MLTKVVQCSKTDAHSYHRWITTIDAVCSGLTLCGERLHPSHTFKQTTEVWCDGICKCGLREDTHGAGAHK